MSGDTLENWPLSYWAKRGKRHGGTEKIPFRYDRSPLSRGDFRENKLNFILVKSVRYTGTNYDEVKALCGDKVLAPYFCMGFTMLSLMTEEGFVTVHECDTIVLDDDGEFHVEK